MLEPPRRTSKTLAGPPSREVRKLFTIYRDAICYAGVA